MSFAQLPVELVMKVCYFVTIDLPGTNIKHLSQVDRRTHEIAIQYVFQRLNFGRGPINSAADPKLALDTPTDWMLKHCQKAGYCRDARPHSSQNAGLKSLVSLFAMGTSTKLGVSLQILCFQPPKHLVLTLADQLMDTTIVLTSVKHLVVDLPFVSLVAGCPATVFLRTTWEHDTYDVGQDFQEEKDMLEGMLLDFVRELKNLARLKILLMETMAWYERPNSLILDEICEVAPRLDTLMVECDFVDYGHARQSVHDMMVYLHDMPSLRHFDHNVQYGADDMAD